MSRSTFYNDISKVVDLYRGTPLTKESGGLKVGVYERPPIEGLPGTPVLRVACGPFTILVLTEKNGTVAVRSNSPLMFKYYNGLLYTFQEVAPGRSEELSSSNTRTITGFKRRITASSNDVEALMIAALAVYAVLTDALQ